MRRSVWVAVCLAVLAGVYSVVQAGNLEPPGPPAPTMTSLQQVQETLVECTEGAPAETAVSGQDDCWDEAGVPIACSGTGQDAALQLGVSVAPRFTDNLNGTVTDHLTGLIWLRNANCFGARSWTSALADANGLADGSCGLSDGSVPGDWHLPNVRELHTLVDYGEYNPSLVAGHPFLGVQSDLYWTSTTYENAWQYAWFVTLNAGRVYRELKTTTYFVLPVRGGQ